MDKSKFISIPKPQLFSFQECLWFLNRNYDDCLHQIKPDGIVKVVKMRERVVLFTITDDEHFLNIEILHGIPDEQTKTFLAGYVIEWFDLNKDLEPFYNLLEQDSRLAYMCSNYKGLRLIGIADLFEALCWSIIGQQINLTFAYKLKRRLVEKYGIGLEYEGEMYYVFPGFEDLSQVTVEELREMQFSQKKAEYIIGVAKAFSKGIISREIIAELPELESKLKALTEIRGIGTWTANYSLMKSLREPLCIPHGDTGLLKALTNHNIIQERNETGKIAEFFKQYRGYESYLVFYLWRSLSHNKG